MSAYDKIRLATTEAALPQGYVIYSHQIPEPSIAVYNDHAQKIGGGDGSQTQHGYASVSMNFTSLDSHQAYILRKLVDDALALSAKVLWVTFDKGWHGSSPPNSWVDGYGFPAIPDIAPSGGSRGALRETITIVINNITIDNDPATGI